MSLVKNSRPSSHHILLSVVTRARCPVCGVSLLYHACVVSVLCVLPRIPKYIFREREERWPQMVSTQGNFCPHACVHGGQPTVILSVLPPRESRILGFVHLEQPTMILPMPYFNQICNTCNDCNVCTFPAAVPFSIYYKTVMSVI